MVRKRKTAREEAQEKEQKEVLDFDENAEPKLSLVEDAEENKRLERLKQAGTGQISDARTFQLMYLEKCALEATLQIQVRKNAYENRIQTLKNELMTITRQWESAQKRAAKKIADIRREVEEDYGINLLQWGFDDETGVLQRLPELEEPEVDTEGGGSKLKENVKQENVPDKGSGAE